jgi:cytidine deaminase
METMDIDARDRELLQAAADVIRRNYHADRHQVGAAVRCASGKIYAGVNVESCGYGPCAEPVAIGAAISAGEREIVAIVAVYGGDERYPVLSPCGNCRQMLVDYAPDAMVILEQEGRPVKARASSLLPMAYRFFEE